MEMVGEAARAKLASPEAFARFYAEMLPHVYGYHFHRSDGPSAAEDLTQETFLAAVDELRKGREVIDPARWIMGIARHKWLDQVRKAARDERRLRLVWETRQIDDAQPARDSGSSPAQALEALRSLPHSQRAAMSLRYLDGYSVPEIAELIGRSVHATESLLARGRENIKNKFTGGQT